MLNSCAAAKAAVCSRCTPNSINGGASSFPFSSIPSLASEEYSVVPGNSDKSFYSMHLNAFYDLQSHHYVDALIQPIRHKDEFKAFCTMADRYPVQSGLNSVFVGDRGYCSYNNMAHVIENHSYFLFRTKDVHSKGMVGNFDLPEKPSFDLDITVTLVRSRSKELVAAEGYTRHIDRATSFDFIEYDSKKTYELPLRIVRFPLTETVFECLVTNLPKEIFPLDRIKTIYHSRWGIESSFRKLKYTIGLSNFHSYKPAFIQQEIWAKLLAYNLTQTFINQAVVKQKKRQ